MSLECLSEVSLEKSVEESCGSCTGILEAEGIQSMNVEKDGGQARAVSRDAEMKVDAHTKRCGRAQKDE